jgi:hypothetical protein
MRYTLTTLISLISQFEIASIFHTRNADGLGLVHRFLPFGGCAGHVFDVFLCCFY